QVEFESHQLDSLGMLIDFDEIKDRVQTFLDEYLDHRLILNEQDPFVPFFQEKKEPLFLMKENPTAENLAKLIFETIQKENMPIVSVKFWETSSACAEYSNSIK
ncbi:MAG: 6-carboxytetrahydropterin synthase, partial [Deltaproteobacteria bacterium]|nr:6-carboxytetrahydropterin synthase [Deltaproteobacteria bacterium]